MRPAGFPLRAVLPLLLVVQALLAACSSRPPGAAPATLPSAAQQQFRQGLLLARQQQPAEALRHFEAAYRQAPGHPPLWLNMGLANSQLQRHGAAAGWLNAWLAAGAASPQRGAIEQQYLREQGAARAQATPLLQQAIRQSFLALQTASPGTDSHLPFLARDMAAGGDIYGALQLLAESQQLLSALQRPADWIPAARDRAWEAYALSLVFTRQPLLADQARSNIRRGPLRDHFWDRLATAPGPAFSGLPAPLTAQLGWIMPMAGQFTTPPRSTAAAAAANPKRPALAERCRQLAEALSAAQSQLSAALVDSAATTATGHTRSTDAATRFNTLLFLMEATAAERLTAPP